MKKLRYITGPMIGATMAAFLVILSAGAADAASIFGKYLDLYVGNAEFEDKSVRASYETVSIFGSIDESAQRDTTFSPAAVAGGRWGFWFKKYPRYGFALDVSHMKIRGEDVSINAIPISGLMFYRLPLLVSDVHPYGMVQPYFGLGITTINGNLSVDFRPDISEKISQAAGGSGVDLRAGIKFFISEKTGFFFELRHLQANIKITDEAEPLLIGMFLTDVVEEASSGITSQQLLVGISFKL